MGAEAAARDRFIAQAEACTGLRVLRAEKETFKYHTHLFPHTIIRVTLSDGRRYVAKRLFVARSRKGIFEEIIARPQPCLQRMRYIFKDDPEGWYYTLSEWSDGVPLDSGFVEPAVMEDAIRKAARSLRKMHDENATHETKRYDHADIERILARDFLSQDLRNLLSSYMLDKLPLINSRTNTLVHGDMHLGNMLVKPGGDVVFIDLDDVFWGDAFVDLIYASNLIISNAQRPLYFRFIREYFGGEPPKSFWPIVNFFSLEKALRIMEVEIERSEDKATQLPLDKIVFEHHDGMRNETPLWYRKMRLSSTWKTLISRVTKHE